MTFLLHTSLTSYRETEPHASPPTGPYQGCFSSNCMDPTKDASPPTAWTLPRMLLLQLHGPYQGCFSSNWTLPRMQLDQCKVYVDPCSPSCRRSLLTQLPRVPAHPTAAGPCTHQLPQVPAHPTAAGPCTHQLPQVPTHPAAAGPCTHQLP